MLQPTRYIQQLVAAHILRLQDIVGMGRLTFQYLQVITETAKAAQAVQINLPIHTIRAAAEHLTVALTQVTADTVGMAPPMLQRRQAITEAGKTAQPVPISLPALHIQATVAQAIVALTVLQADIA